MDDGCSRAGWLLLGLMVASTAASAQRLNPAPPPPPPPAATAPAANNTEAKLPAHESILPDIIGMPKEAPPPPGDPLIAGHDLEVGTFYYDKGDWVGALARFQDAIYNDPHSPEPYCRAGDTEDKLKHVVRARAQWQRCLTVAGEGKWADHARKALAQHPAPPAS